MESIKTGSLQKVINEHDWIMNKFKNVLTNDEIEELFVPLLSDDDDIDNIINAPFGYAMMHNFVDICDWMYKNCKNVKINMDNSEYSLFDEVCYEGHLDVVKWLFDNIYYIKYQDYHIDSFIHAINGNHIDVADYLYQQYTQCLDKDCIIRDCMYSLVKDKNMIGITYLFKKIFEDEKLSSTVRVILDDKDLKTQIRVTFN